MDSKKENSSAPPGSAESATMASKPSRNLAFMGSFDDSKIAHRGHESVARLGAPASLPASFRTHTATRRQGCRRSQFRFMGSLDLQLWTRIAAMNRGVWEADPCLSAEIGRTQSAGKSSGSVSSKSLCSILRFRESFHDIGIAHRDHEPDTGSAAFMPLQRRPARDQRSGINAARRGQVHGEELRSLGCQLPPDSGNLALA